MWTSCVRGFSSWLGGPSLWGLWWHSTSWQEPMTEETNYFLPVRKQRGRDGVGPQYPCQGRASYDLSSSYQVPPPKAPPPTSSITGW